MGLLSQVLQPQNTFTMGIYIFRDIHSIAMLLIFTALYIKLNNTSSSLPVSRLGAESLHESISHPNLQPQKEQSAEGSQQNFIYTVQTCIIPSL